MNKIDLQGPVPENAGRHNTLALPDELREENFPLRSGGYVHFKAQNGLFLDIDSSGWAVWSATSRAIFSKYYYSGDLYLIYEYGNAYTGRYLSYSNSGYIGVYPWSKSVAWHFDPLGVKGESWRTYEYDDGPAYIVIGDYEYTQRDLYLQEGF
jgi:hypothetical protein